MADIRELFRSFKTDPSKEVDGAWVEIPLSVGAGEALTVRCKVRPWFNPDHAAAYLAGMAPHQSSIDNETLEEGVVNRVHTDAMLGGALLLDWDLTWDGEEVPFTDEHARILLLELPRFREGIAKASKTRAAFLDDGLEAAAERLGKTFVGNSSTPGSSKRRRTKKG